MAAMPQFPRLRIKQTAKKTRVRSKGCRERAEFLEFALRRTKRDLSRLLERTAAGDCGRRSGLRRPRAKGSSPSRSGGFGHQSAGTMTGARGARCNRGRRRRETPARLGACSAKPGPEPHLGMRESQGESRRGTPTGERALRRVRAAPYGAAGRPAPFGVLLPFLPFVRAPCLIVMNPADPLPVRLTKVGIAARFLGVAWAKLGARTKSAARE